MKVIIAGSRTASKRDVWNAICACPFRKEITEVICGCAQGADTFGAQWAKSLNIPVSFMPADWNKFGKSAGYKRNAEMASIADGLLAIWDGQSRGTADMIARIKAKKAIVFVHTF